MEWYKEQMPRGVYASRGDATASVRKNLFRVLAVTGVPEEYVLKMRPHCAFHHEREFPLAGANNIAKITQQQFKSMDLRIKYNRVVGKGDKAHDYTEAKTLHQFLVENPTVAPRYGSDTWDAKTNIHPKYRDADCFNLFPGLRAQRLPKGTPIDVKKLEPVIYQIEQVLCNGNAAAARAFYIFLYRVFNGRKAKSIPAFYSKRQQAGGKGLFLNWLVEMVLGPSIAVQIGSIKDFSRAFNEFLSYKIFCHIDEVSSSDHHETLDAQQIIKGLTTEKVRMGHRKNKDSKQELCMLNFSMATNLIDSLKLEPGNQRLTPIQTGERDAAYFAKLVPVFNDPQLPSHFLEYVLSPKGVAAADPTFLAAAEADTTAIPVTPLLTRLLAGAQPSEERFLMEVCSMRDGFTRTLKIDKHKYETKEETAAPGNAVHTTVLYELYKLWCEHGQERGVKGKKSWLACVRERISFQHKDSGDWFHLPASWPPRPLSGPENHTVYTPAETAADLPAPSAPQAEGAC